MDLHSEVTDIGKHGVGQARFSAAFPALSSRSVFTLDASSNLRVTLSGNRLLGFRKEARTAKPTERPRGASVKMAFSVRRRMTPDPGGTPSETCSRHGSTAASTR